MSRWQNGKAKKCDPAENRGKNESVPFILPCAALSTEINCLTPLANDNEKRGRFMTMARNSVFSCLSLLHLVGRQIAVMAVEVIK